jgi:hypothetical protein
VRHCACSQVHLPVWSMSIGLIGRARRIANDERLMKLEEGRRSRNGSHRGSQSSFLPLYKIAEDMYIMIDAAR